MFHDFFFLSLTIVWSTADKKRRRVNITLKFYNYRFQIVGIKITWVLFP